MRADYQLAEQEGRYVRPSAAVSVVVAIDKLLRHKQVDVHPTSAPRVEICDHLTPVSLRVSLRLSASQKLRPPAQNVHVVGEVPVGCRREVTAS
jgi:hypothetical protein